jgi:AAA15 family ATPase/GTPase
MLNHLHIQNYRLFRDLQIDKLGQVNLIAGKNNTGKTALLEALRIFQNKCSFEIITNVIHLRNDLDRAKPLDSLATLFGKPEPYNKGLNYAFKINDSSWGVIKSGDRIRRHRGSPNTQTMASNDAIDFFNYEFPHDETIYVPFSSDLQINMRTGFWEKIEFDDNEKRKIVDILNVISDKKIKQISMSDKTPRIQFANGDVEKLTKSGDGANRLLTLALALVNAKNKMLLIDEFEVGLHHSVQEQLWDIIFKYAKEWDIQVFVTTHSQDTVRSFYYVAEKTPQYRDMANYFTLNRTGDGDVEAINYDLEEMETAFMSNLEIR